MRTWGMVLLALALIAGPAYAQEGDESANIDIRSTLVGTRVYLADTYVGDADLFLDNVPPGDHMIIMRQGSQRINGQFSVKAGETLMLEGRFEENRIVDLKKVAREDAMKRAEAERKAEEERKAEAEKKKEQAAAVPEKKKPEPKKPTAAAVKPAKNAADERRDQYLTLIRVDFNESGSTDVKIVARANAKSTTNFTDNQSTSGKLVRSKQNYTLCDGAECFRDWTGRFFYIDDTGKRDAFLIRWRETIFSGITPQGTSKKDMDLCLNGDCKQITYSPEGSGTIQTPIDRYVLIWAKGNFTIRRADLLKEITDAGGKVPEF
ncbi:MAG: hypothetical protein OEW15_10775 [Nitrospirota bacterium]|nr:hypothetical protein [Nitrospirota bacterium]